MNGNVYMTLPDGFEMNLATVRSKYFSIPSVANQFVCEVT